MFDKLSLTFFYGILIGGSAAIPISRISAVSASLTFLFLWSYRAEVYINKSRKCSNPQKCVDARKIGYLKDVIERNKIQSVDEIGILVDVLASAIGAPTNPSKIANTFASERQMTYSNKTISNHIDRLADAFLISKASRYDIKGRKYIGANLKYYFTDMGLRNARLNFRQQEPTHIMENIVYNELRIRGYNVDVGVVEIFDKDKEGKPPFGSSLFVHFRGTIMYVTRKWHRILDFCANIKPTHESKNEGGHLCR